MERKVLLVCCAVGLLGLLSAAAGFGAEQTRIKRSQVRFAFVIAFFLLVAGAALNHRRGVESMYSGNSACYVVKPGVFAGGALLSFASVVLGTVYYVNLNSAKNSDMSWGGSIPNQGAIAMGQPRIPPTQCG